MKKSVLSVIVMSFLMLTSCSKDTDIDNSAAAALFGNWTFTGMDANTISDNTSSSSNISVREVINAQYSTTENQGSLTFTNDAATNTGVSYQINGVQSSVAYVNGIHDASNDSPADSFHVSIPSYNASGAYRAYGSDSLYFPNGGFATINTATSQYITITDPIGYKYALTNDSTLVLTATVISNQSTNSGGQSTAIKSTAVFQLYYKKK